jgi:hypothetical protein
MRHLFLRWKISRITRAARQLLLIRGVASSPWWFGAYHIDPKHLVFVLPVDSDKSRDTLKADKELLTSLRNLLVSFNWPPAARADVVFDIESAETVQRESSGNWWYHYK